ncbi:ABC transporter permease [Demequina gelatinilytica]|uniref:ABC transporter permease n=1 Tax=Demequina gelatinilytica TaxID=1638980 RepID=UPI0007834B2F|nr:ABC transporter permease [Demequina gelatinilytica]
MIKLKKNAALVAGIAVLAALALYGLIVPLVSQWDPNLTVGMRLEGPSAEHWLGTDHLGRDNFVRLAIAARYALAISFISSIISMVLGTAVGLLAGYAGGRLDNLLMRGTEIIMAIPAILFALVIRVIIGPGFVPLLIAMAIIGAPGFARIMRSPILVLRDRDFVVAAEIAGVRKPWIAVSHLLPNATTPMLVNFASTASLAVLIESSLSFLGQGVQAPDASAGRMIQESMRFMNDDPLLIVLPVILITLLTVGWNLLADGVQMALSPKAGNLAVPTRGRRRKKLPGGPTQATAPTRPEDATPAPPVHHDYVGA